MQPTTAPEPYTPPQTIRMTRGSYIGFTLAFLVIIAVILDYLVRINFQNDPVTWILCFLIAVIVLVCYILGMLQKIQLTEDRIYYRGWFDGKEMEYTRITRVLVYFVQNPQGGDIPMLEIADDAGTTITFTIGGCNSPANFRILYEVLKKHAIHARIADTIEEFYAVPDLTPWHNYLTPQPYTLPLTLRMNESSHLIWYITFPLLIGVLMIFAMISESLVNIPGWVVFLGGIAAFLLAYRVFTSPAVRLTNDRIAYREWFFWKEMEYTQITSVRYYSYDLLAALDTGPKLEVSDDNGNTITLNFGMGFTYGNFWIIYDVLKTHAIRANLQKSPVEFFVQSGSRVGS